MLRRNMRKVANPQRLVLFPPLRTPTLAESELSSEEKRTAFEAPRHGVRRAKGPTLLLRTTGAYVAINGFFTSALTSGPLTAPSGANGVPFPRKRNARNLPKQHL